MLQALQTSASSILLFLKNVRTISIFVNDPAVGLKKLSFTTEISEIGNQNTSKTITDFVAGTPQSPQTKEAFYQKLASIPPHLMPASDYVVETVTRSGDLAADYQVVKEKFAVCSLIGGEKLLQMAINPAMHHLRLIPWAGVAFLISRQLFKGTKYQENSANQQETEIQTETDIATLKTNGRVYCFLPLPVETGLPVHVHACFELSSNRRDIQSSSLQSGNFD